MLETKAKNNFHPVNFDFFLVSLLFAFFRLMGCSLSTGFFAQCSEKGD